MDEYFGTTVPLRDMRKASVVPENSFMSLLTIQMVQWKMSQSVLRSHQPLGHL